MKSHGPIPTFITTSLRVAALLVILPLALLLAFHARKMYVHSRDIVVTWTPVEATIVDADQRGKMTLDVPWNGGLKRVEMDKEWGRTIYSNGQQIALYVNPKDPADVHRTAFDDLWAGPIVLGGFSGVITGIAALMWWLTRVPDTAGIVAKESVVHSAGHEALAIPEKTGAIKMRDPSESWKANVFWGLLFGLLLVIPAFYAPADTPLWKKWGVILLGFLWMLFMGRSAIQRRGRMVRCDDKEIMVIQPFASRTIPLSEVRKVVRNDLGRKFRKLEEFGMSREQKFKRMDTMASIVIYQLYNAANEELLRLDSHMEPPEEMSRFLKRMEEHTGKAIVDE